MKSKKIYDYITKVAIFSALSFILYLFPKFPLPFFPSFLEIQFSNLPAILGGFVLGPIGGCIIVVVRFILKLIISPSPTSPVGEIADLILGLGIILVSSLIYKRFKSKKGGALALSLALVTWVFLSVVVNRFINIPLFVKLSFDGNIQPLVEVCKVVIPNINESNFMHYYLLYAVIPFNFLLGLVVCSVTFFVYKRISSIFKHDFIKNNSKRIKTLIICDSFKGTLSSIEVAQIIKNNMNPNKYQVDEIIISDGGEGFLDAIENPSTYCTVISSFDALGRNKNCRYLVNEETQTLYFELAEVVGIKNLKQEELNVFSATTYGLGIAIKHAIEQCNQDGMIVKEIVIGIGGSASNDAACGLLEAMGVKFYDANHNRIENLCNHQLQYVEELDITDFKTLIGDIKFTVLTDVVNPLLGEFGATYVYSPQKGAKISDLEILESNLKHFSEVCYKYFKEDNTKVPGAGAAGGVGYGMVTFFNAILKSGIDTLLEMNNFKEIVGSYDLVISGEGCVDEQSLQGKVLSGIITHQPKRLELVVGFSKLENCKYKVHAVVPEVATMEESLSAPKKYLSKLIKKKFK